MRFLHYITIIAIGLAGIIVTSCNEVENNDVENGIQSTDRVAERHELSAVMEDGEWKIVDTEDPDNVEIVVAPGDTVVWNAPPESELYFQFMDDRLTGEFTEVASRGESVSLIIGERAKEGDNPYAAFVINDSTYARGESPPRMIVRR
ncbi:MAG: hypothetical protein GVY08_07375 [Bacteroidetes bacterium]|jgi:hypothetical protein|nr:hypothetical protein [Bacteroidota bacterium]